MPVYEYKGLTEAGKNVRGVRDADNLKALRAALRKDGIFLTEVTAEKAAAGGSGGTAIRGREVDVQKLVGSRVSTSDIAIMTRQLAVLLGAGVALVEGLSTLQEQIDHPRLKLIVSQVKTKVNEGASLADALAQHPKVFSQLYVNMIRAGEHSGALDVVLNRLADFTESQARLKNKVIGTMIYPALMVVVGLLILGVLLTVVVPNVTKIFETNRLTLPLVTRILIAISDFAQNYWWMLLGGTALAIFAFRKWKKTEKGRATWDAFTLRVPVFGKLIRKLAVARFARTLSTLLKSGVPLLSALEIVQNIVANAVMSGVIDKARDSIREGESIAAPLRRSGEFPPLVYHMISIGERSGQLEDMLINVADAYDDEVEVSISALTSLLEPVMIIGMGGSVAFIVFAILIPILQLNTMMQ
ncbi:MAG: type II secretion system inner membrane protein GspF [Myxococcales bacterium]|jgi:general secretion pathway protein F|nr:type II secretion system inner membrane protein GspF [Myxococcales bacterium]